MFKGTHEAVHCNACLAITDAIRGTSQERPYRELGLEILNHRRWSRKLYFFIKLSKYFPLHEALTRPYLKQPKSNNELGQGLKFLKFFVSLLHQEMGETR